MSTTLRSRPLTATSSWHKDIAPEKNQDKEIQRRVTNGRTDGRTAFAKHA
ncbi:hypothetical protein NP493_546g01014 [Ridgeia piscesae]|uniref:Uncharacterized protein n=1 Tax=Ridgeia piscesae TaxID=27915 RepID=A0AAD9KVK7_RIDPI|nr:hypothetical protein NP493_546g01014 [Ridgeia piscesae]